MDKISPTFNKLSFMDRMILKGAALTHNSVDFVTEDLKKHPKRFPLYTGYLAMLGLTFLIPGGKIAMALGTLALLKLRSPWALRARKKLSESFDEEKVVERFDDYIAPRDFSKKRSRPFHVERGRLYRTTHSHVTKNLKDIWKNRAGGDPDDDGPQGQEPNTGSSYRHYVRAPH